jgi:hypothetical protein
MWISDRSSVLRLVLVATVTTASACAVEPGEGEPQRSTNTSAVTFSIDTSIARPSEDRMLELAQEIEGFAGYYCENADLVVGLAGSSDPIRDAHAAETVKATGVAYTCYNRELPMKVPQVRDEAIHVSSASGLAGHNRRRLFQDRRRARHRDQLQDQPPQDEGRPIQGYGDRGIRSLASATTRWIHDRGKPPPGPLPGVTRALTVPPLTLAASIRRLLGSRLQLR